MDTPPPLAAGFVRLAVRLRTGESTPGAIARATGIPPEHIGPVIVSGDSALVDVRAEHGRDARDGLIRIGATQLIERHWQWLRIAIGRNHGLTMGQLRRIMHVADALPLGRISISNTHTLIGLLDNKLAGVVERMSAQRVNGYAVRPEALPMGTGPGSAAFMPRGQGA